MTSSLVGLVEKWRRIYDQVRKTVVGQVGFHAKRLELGFFDHGRSIEPLWRQLAKRRGLMYSALASVGQAQKPFSDAVPRIGMTLDDALDKSLVSLAKAVSRPIRKLESAADRYAKTVNTLHDSYRGVLARPASTVVLPGAMASLRKRTGVGLRDQLVEDMAILEVERKSVLALRGYVAPLTRECERYEAAIATILAASESLIVMCDKAEFITANATQLLNLPRDS
jgi:hypothetical protein